MPLPVTDYEWVRVFLTEWKLEHSAGGANSSVAYRLRRYSEDSPDSALALLVALAEQSADEKERMELAESVEALLQKHGAAYWDTMNALCSQVPQFRTVMSYVWGASLSKELKRKVEMWHA